MCSTRQFKINLHNQHNLCKISLNSWVMTKEVLFFCFFLQVTLFLTFDCWKPKSNQFILDFLWIFVPNLNGLTLWMFHSKALSCVEVPVKSLSNDYTRIIWCRGAGWARKYSQDIRWFTGNPSFSRRCLPYMWLPNIAGPTCTWFTSIGWKSLLLLKMGTNSENNCLLTYSELGGSCRILMETEHNNLQAVTSIGAFEEARL